MAKEKIQFTILHLDPLGQGVHKEGEKIYFIPKTLPGEKGIATVIKKKKGVYFAKLLELQESSPLRLESPCSHYSLCSGCQYLHCAYEEELKFKTKNFQKVLTPLKKDILPDHILENGKRFHYRNRIQLHYHQKSRALGFVGENKKILPVPQCLLPQQSIKEKMDEFYHQNSWLKALPRQKNFFGHVEIYHQPNKELQITWNENYGEGGFSQVNNEINTIMLDRFSSLFEKSPPKQIFDLFGGKGNLSLPLVKKFQASHTVIDIYDHLPQAKHFYSLNLYQKDSLQKIIELAQIKKPDTLLLDPPRSGFKELHVFLKQSPSIEQILYVSCHPATMVRDLREVISKFVIKESFMIDLFPGTRHFEVALLLKKNQS